MAGQALHDVFCPRCGYNLRGLTLPRCPECGFTFDFEQLAIGLLRENIPTRLDRADLWQPHQVLLGSLVELARGVRHPRRWVQRVDVNGRLVPAMLMLLGATLWMCGLVTAITAAGIAVRTGASPAAAVRAGALVWAPALLLPAYVAGLAGAVLATWPELMRVARPRARQQVRLAALVVPVLASYGSVPFAVLVAVTPEFSDGLQPWWPGAVVLAGLLASVHRRQRGADAAPECAAQERAPPSRGRLFHMLRGRGAELLRLVLFVGFSAAAMLLARWLAPHELEPPWWIY